MLAFLRTFRSAGSSGRKPVPGSPVLVVVATLLLSFRGGTAQQPADPPRLAYPQRAELTLLAPTVGSGGAWLPGARLTYQRRVGLHPSVSVSGLYIPATLTRTVGVVAGGAWAVVAGPVLLEPFMEAGAGWLDARVADGSFDVLEGGELRTVERYRAVQGVAPLLGAGVSAAGVLADRFAARLSAGWWWGGVGDVSVSGLRLGLSLGLTRPNRRWYEHRTDRIEPTVAAVGAAIVDGSSIEVDRGVIRILAGDASGVAEIRVADEAVPLEPLAPGVAAAHRLPSGAVVAEARVSPGPAGEVLPIEVRDSAGQRRVRRVHVVGPPDRSPPTASVTPPSDRVESWPGVWVTARDETGIVAATIDDCPVRPGPVASGPGGQGEPHWLVRALVLGGDSVAVVVRDQAGNEDRIMAPVPPLPSATGPPPVLTLAAEATSAMAGRRSVRVHGTITDPHGLEIARVRIDGEPAVIQDLGSHARIDGWLTLDAGIGAVRIEVLTADGRRLSARVPVTDGDQTGTGRLHAVVFSTDTAALPVGTLETAAGGQVKVLRGPRVAARELEDAIFATAREMEPGDAVLVYLEGVLLGPQLRAAAGRDGSTLAPRQDPLLALSGRPLDLQRLGEFLGWLQGEVTLVSARFWTTRGWGVQPSMAPGALPPAGCITTDPERRAGIADLGGASLVRIGEALAGAADLDGDGRILAGELMEHLGVAPAGGLLPFDPFALVVEPEVAP